MESIAAAYGSSPESSNSSSSDEEESSPFEDEVTLNSEVHVGVKRKRSSEPQWTRAFPHVDGNWPSHVRIDIPVTQKLRDVATEIIKRTQEFVGDAVDVVPFEELEVGKEEQGLHLSLSRPFVLRYDQIDAFVDALRAVLKWRHRFSITLQQVLVLLNDEKTRSFLALRVGEGEQHINRLLRCVDQCLEQFKQPTYYENPIPHVSIASSMGEELVKLTSDHNGSLTPRRVQLEQLKTPICLTAGVVAVHVVIGNKHYDIPLQ
ncbi:poly(U)-specific 3'-to-5' RNA exonuclease [Phytophthora boehmeriae]|uniref:U6 snRNA phosphodiesterase n=1 Tax=Phytophthora boehmeriae TaxID=109152 RepID=A0A8T1X022_9STRA|nr:poly(U)-specific 3'-to-5' RNA exonuclease [Phytophthora boehmeriae]